MSLSNLTIAARIPMTEERQRLLREMEATRAKYAAQKTAFDQMWAKLSLDADDSAKDKCRAWFCMGWDYREGLGK